MNIAEQVMRAKEDYDAVYEAGVKTENDRFWDTVIGGNPSEQGYMFYGWDCEYLRPPRKKYVTKKCLCFFAENKKLKKVEKDYFDFSGFAPNNGAQATTGWYAIFRNCFALEEIEDIGMQAGSYYYTFGWCGKLHTIAIVRCNKDTPFTSAFVNCLNLTNIAFEGEIGKDITFLYSPLLSVASMKNTISHLHNYSEESPLTTKVTFATESWANLEASGKPYDDGLTDDAALTWKEYVQYELGWNV